MRPRRRIRVAVAIVLVSLTCPSTVAAQEDTAWVRLYHGPGPNNDRACAVRVDRAGNVYVTGRSVGDGTLADYATLKYTADGDTLWVRRYNGPGNGDDFANALQVDTVGNVYVTGMSDGSGTYGDYATVKYNSDGNLIWVRRYHGPGNYADCANDLQVDAAGNVYVTGWSDGSSGANEYATIKYDAGGNTLWVRRYLRGPFNFYNQARALQVDRAGCVYVTGVSFGDETITDYTTIKYSADGDTVWLTFYDGPDANEDEAYALQVDAAGNVYVTGGSKSSAKGTAGEWDYATVKYDASGNTIWARRYNGPGNSDDVAYALQVDSTGNVYVTGASHGDGTDRDYATVKYDADGDTIWIRRYNGIGNGIDDARSLEIDQEGNVYVTGRSEGIDTNEDCVTIVYDPDGQLLKEWRYDGPRSLDDSGEDLQLDADGNVLVTGYCNSGKKYLTIKYLSGCGCPFQSDFDEDGFLTALDLSSMIDILFAGHNDVRDPLCPSPRADFDCDDFSTALDLSGLIDHIFSGGEGPCEPCEL